MRRRPLIESLENRVLLASDWQNAWRPLDVNGDNFLSPQDALVGVNRLNRLESGALPPRASNSTEPHYDTNGDGFHSPIDILLVVNTLNGGLQVSADLGSDSGSGPGANADRITNDPTIQGIARANADNLMARVGEGAWVDVSQLLGTDGNFEISDHLLEELIGGPLTDGQYRVDLQAGYADSGRTVIDRTFVEFELDRTSPSSRIVGDILMTSPGRIVIPSSEQLVAASVLPSQVSVYDITWGEKAGDPNWGLDGEHPRFAVQPLSVQVSEDGLQLVLTIPNSTRSANYLVELRGVVEDRAGNRFAGESDASAASVKANYFSTNAPQFLFGNTYRNLIETEERILEFSFKLQAPETLLWTGDLTLGTLSRYEIYDKHGHLLHRFLPGTIQQPGSARLPALLPMPAGEFRLRVVDPPGTLGHFRIYRTSELPNFPTDRSLGNSDLWPLDAYKLDLEAGERLYVEALEESDVLHTVFDPFGEQIRWISNGQDQYYDASLPGEYVFMVNRVGYRSYRSIPSARTIEDSGERITGTLNNPGQVVQLSITVASREIYLLKAQMGRGISLSFDYNDMQISELNSNWVVLPSSARLDLRLERLSTNLADVDYELNLTRLSDASQLPIDSWLDAPIAGEFQAYRFPDGESVMLDGQREFTIVSQQQGSLSVSPRFGPAVVFNHFEFDSALLVVSGSANSAQWRAMAREQFVQPLVFGAANPVHFESGLESYEFTFDGVPGEFIGGHLLPNPASLPSNLDSSAIQLFDPNGRVVPNGNPWKIVSPGEHRMVLRPQSQYVRGDAHLLVTRSSAWQPLQLDVMYSIAPRSREFYAIPSDLDTLFLAPANGDRLVQRWQVFDQAGKNLFESYSSTIENTWVDLPSGTSYYLEVDNHRSGYEPFEFRSSVSATTTYGVGLNEGLSGQLIGHGDRARIEYVLQRGQRVEWESFSFDATSIDAWLINPAQKQSAPSGGTWLVPESGVYTLELRNNADATAVFETRMVERSAPRLGEGLSGFETEYQGQLTRTEQNEGTVVFPFEVESNAPFILDWLDSDQRMDLQYLITGPNGEFVWYESFARDSGLINFPVSGQYRVELGLLAGIDSGAYKFALRNLAVAPLIEPGQQVVGAVLAPFESRLYRMDLEEAVDLELIGPTTSFPSVSVQSLYPGTSAQSGVFNGVVTYAAGSLAIRSTSFSEEPLELSFSTRVHEHLIELFIDRSDRVLLNPGTNLFQFTSATPNSQVSVSLAPSGAGYRIFDSAGNEMLPGIADRFTLPISGTFRLEVAVPDGTINQVATLSVDSVPIEPRAYEIGQAALHTFALQGETVLYQFDVHNDGVYFLRTADGTDVRLRDSAGRLLTRSPRDPLQYFRAGQYKAQITALHDASTIAFSIFPIQDLQIPTGSHSGELRVGESERVFRFILPANRAIILNASEGAIVSYLTDGTNSPEVVQGDVLIRPSQIQNLFVFVARSPLISDNVAQYDFSVSPAPVHNLTLEIDSAQSGELGAWQQLEVNFTLAESNSVLIQSTLFDTRLFMPSGRQVSVGTTWGGSEFFNLPPGDYKLVGIPSSFFKTFHISVSSFQTATVLDLPFDGQLSANMLYQFDVPAAALHSLSIQDSLGTPTNAYRVWNEFGERVSLLDRRLLPQGRYWITVPGTNAQILRLAPISVHQTSGQLGEQLTLQTNDTTDAAVRFSAPVGALLDLPALVVPSSVTGLFRIIPNSVTLPRDHGWSSIDEWIVPRYIKQDSTVEFLFSGSGTSILKLVDWRLAPELKFDLENNDTLLSHHRRLTWRIPAVVTGAYLITVREAGQSTSRWWISDSIGNEVASLTKEAILSFGAPEAYYLVLEPSMAPTAEIPVQALISPLNA